MPAYQKTLDVMLNTYSDALLKLFSSEDKNRFSVEKHENWPTPNRLTKIGFSYDQSFYFNAEFGDPGLPDNRRYAYVLTDIADPELDEELDDTFNEFLCEVMSEAPDEYNAIEDYWDEIEEIIKYVIICPTMVALLALGIRKKLGAMPIELAPDLDVYTFDSVQSFWKKATVSNLQNDIAYLLNSETFITQEDISNIIRIISTEAFPEDDEISRIMRVFTDNNAAYSTKNVVDVISTIESQML